MRGQDSFNYAPHPHPHPIYTNEDRAYRLSRCLLKILRNEGLWYASIALMGNKQSRVP